MAYVRVSYVVPREGREAQATETLRKLGAFYASQPGYVRGYVLQPRPGAMPAAMGRVGVWVSDRAAEDAAQVEHGLALRAELMRHIVEESHLELSFVADEDGR